MSVFNDILSNNNLTSDEKAQEFLKKLSEMAEAPEWEGVSVPNIPKVRNYIRASEILQNLFEGLSGVELSFDEPRYFQANTTGEVTIWSSFEEDISSVFFQNSEATSMVSEFLSLVDHIDVSVWRSLGENMPKFCMKFFWYVSDTMLGCPDD